MSRTIFLTMYYDKKIVNTNSKIFFNIQCGKKDSSINLQMIGDDTGDNISNKNKYWSEITGNYWFYKNFTDLKKYDYVGLNSYRRFFNFKFNEVDPIYFSTLDEVKNLLDKYSNSQIEKLMKDYDAITPIPFTYRSSIWTICKKNYNENDFLVLREVVREKYPDYLSTFDQFFFKNNKMIGHNMFIMRTDDFIDFSEWVFNILFEVEQKINPTNYNVQMIRVFGYMHELLLNIYIEKNMSKILRSQLSFVDKRLKGFKFNNPLYRYLCNIIFFISKRLSGDKNLES